MINDDPDCDGRRPNRGGAIINTGVVIAVLCAIPSFFVGLFGAVGVVTGQKLIAGSMGAIWGYLAVAGAYELNRRKFDWSRGARYGDLHLLGGTLAVSVGLIIGGAIYETMPALAIIPALSAIRQAGDGHDNRFLSWIHATVLLAGIAAAIWLYRDGVTGKVWLEMIAALP